MVMAQSYLDGQPSGLAMLYLVMSREIWIGMVSKTMRKLVHHMGANTDSDSLVIMVKYSNATPSTKLAAVFWSFRVFPHPQSSCCGWPVVEGRQSNTYV